MTLTQKQKDSRKKREETYRKRREAHEEKLREQARAKAEAYQSWLRFLKAHGSFKEALFAIVGDYDSLDIKAQIGALKACAWATQGNMERQEARMAREARFEARYGPFSDSKMDAKLAKIEAVANDARGNANVRAAAQAMADKIRGRP